MVQFQEFKSSIWRVPLIALIGGLFYVPSYVRIVTYFGVIEPGVIDDKISLLASGLLLIITFVLGWAILLRKQTRTEIFVSSSIVVVYGVILCAVQFYSGSTTGPAAVVFLHLSTPLEWTGFPTELGLYLQKHSTITIPFIGFVRFFVPWLYIIFGRKVSKQIPE